MDTRKKLRMSSSLLAGWRSRSEVTLVQCLTRLVVEVQVTLSALLEWKCLSIDLPNRLPYIIHKAPYSLVQSVTRVHGVALNTETLVQAWYINVATAIATKIPAWPVHVQCIVPVLHPELLYFSQDHMWHYLIFFFTHSQFFIAMVVYLVTQRNYIWCNGY